jgi:hypothetical protein
MYYTYTHSKPTGEIFYVGKGSGKRAFEMLSNRSEHHNRIVKKYGKENIKVIIRYAASEQQAYLDEIMWIKILRLHGFELCNICAGGEGGSGFERTQEYRNKFRGSNNSMFGKKGANNPNYGRSRPQAVRAKISESVTGSKNPNFGKKWDIEKKQKHAILIKQKISEKKGCRNDS